MPRGNPNDGRDGSACEGGDDQSPCVSIASASPPPIMCGGGGGGGGKGGTPVVMLVSCGFEE